MTFPQDTPAAEPAGDGIERYFAWQEELLASGKLVETHPIAVDGVGMFVVGEIALDLDTPREEHLGRLGLS
ncbi:hypothetical protein [Amycolatopsis oliviviridis]|nr:hypothetical protein [Amycolatopsis oliviviridis]